MLPLGNRPVIDYMVRDCVKAGITDIYFVVSGSASQLRSYYERDIELEDKLRQNGKEEMIESIMPPSGTKFHYIEQDLSDGRYGTSVPVWLCRDYVEEDELVLIMMGDDVTYVTGGVSDIEKLVSLNQPAILGVPITENDLSSYGVIKLRQNSVFDSIVEKPEPGKEPSRMINVSKYVLPGSFMTYVDMSVRGPVNSSGEYYITDPINQLVANGAELSVLEAAGKYLDTGSLEAWVDANVWLFNNS
jgi:UTP--glucose-1-phosphate uridylyltransferase